jgi:hypothetical protein
MMCCAVFNDTEAEKPTTAVSAICPHHHFWQVEATFKECAAVARVGALRMRPRDQQLQLKDEGNDERCN